MKSQEKQENFWDYHHAGLIPGPSESHDQFLLRTLSLPLPSLPYKHPFGPTPNWVCVHEASKNLPFWEGAATWIEQAPSGARTCWIQLKSSVLSKLYSKEEILSHELTHAMRLMFDEPRFEEILAFRTSKHPLRRYFGPLFTSPRQTRICLWLLLIAWLLYLIWEHPIALALPALSLGYCLTGLIRSQFLFARAERVVKQVIYDPSQSMAALLYFTDAEIAACSSSQALLSYALIQQGPRWTQWKALFLSAAQKPLPDVAPGGI